MGNPNNTTDLNRGWLLDPDTPNDILADAAQGNIDPEWPLPATIMDHLRALAAHADPTPAEINAARIPLFKWFEDQRGAVISDT